MATIFADGFDWYLTADASKRWTISAQATMTTGPGYARAPSGQGCYPGFTGANTVPGPIYKAFGANYTGGVVGFAFNLGTTTNVSRVIATIADGTAEQISIRTNSSGVLTVSRAGTLLATGSTVLSTSTWYYIELKFTIHASAGVIELHLNGATEIASTSSLNTRATANTQWNAVGLGTSSANSVYYLYDDLYVLDTSTGSNTDFLGPIRVVALYPAGAGNYAQWTPNGGSNDGSVSETYNDEDNSFNQSATANQIDSFVFQDLPVVSGSVFAIQHILVARQDAGAARTIAPLQRSGGSDYVGTTKALSTTYQFLTDIKDVNPVDSAAFEVADVNGAEFGYKLIS